jgi:hypothetical protein
MARRSARAAARMHHRTLTFPRVIGSLGLISWALCVLLCGCSSHARPSAQPQARDAATPDAGTGSAKADSGKPRRDAASPSADAASPRDASLDGQVLMQGSPGSFVQVVGGGAGRSQTYHLSVRLGTGQALGNGQSAHLRVQLSGPAQP